MATSSSDIPDRGDDDFVDFVDFEFFKAFRRGGCAPRLVFFIAKPSHLEQESRVRRSDTPSILPICESDATRNEKPVQHRQRAK